MQLLLDVSFNTLQYPSLYYFTFILHSILYFFLLCFLIYPCWCLEKLLILAYWIYAIEYWIYFNFLSSRQFK